MNRRALTVNLGEVRLARLAGEELVAFGLGSCVALCAWDPKGPVAAMAHIVLPRSGNPSTSRGQDSRLDGKYADQAVPLIVKLLHDAGADPARAWWKLAGGAHVLRVAGLPAIGEQNLAAVRVALRQCGLRLVAEDTGGPMGRTVRLRVENGQLLVRLANGEERVL